MAATVPLCFPRIDWIIVGGESGPGHRPVDPNWVRSLRDQALAADVAFFFKQWGGPTPKAGGRLLDGRTWDQYPTTWGGAPTGFGRRLPWGTRSWPQGAGALGRVGVDLSAAHCRAARWRVFDPGQAAKTLARTWAQRQISPTDHEGTSLR